MILLRLKSEYPCREKGSSYAYCFTSCLKTNYMNDCMYSVCTNGPAGSCHEMCVFVQGTFIVLFLIIILYCTAR